MAGKRWNGSAWIDHTTKKRWNGSAWIDLTTAKRWNGSAWVDIYAGGGSSLTFTPSSSTFAEEYACDSNLGSCPISQGVSDFVTYTIGGETGAYSVVAVYIGDPVTVDYGTPGTITVSTSCGRNVTKEGDIKITVTDTVGSKDFYLPYLFSYVWTPEDGGGGGYPPPEEP